MKNKILERLPALPDGAAFRPVKVDTVILPHPFMITPRHVAYASDYHFGRLDNEAIDRSGAPCGMPRCQLSIAEHESMKTLFVEVPDNRKDLNSYEGLGPWLCQVKEANLGIEGFAFPNKKT